MHIGPPQALIVDDDPQLLRILGHYLRGSGFDVREAGDGEEALQAIRTHCPHYIITDWDMPRLDGLELCRRVRQESLPHYVYILFLTSKSTSHELIQALEAGADEFVSKPIDPNELLARLRSGQRVLDLERKLHEAARSDPLTGIPTRRAFYEHFEREFARARRYRLPLSCVMLDVDFFKKINDVHGHPAGDEVLKAVARLLDTSRRSSDYVCRHGGEEFCFILPETSEQAATIWAERTRAAVAALRVNVGTTELKVTASFGVSELLEDMTSSEQIVDHADQALLVAKQSGRDHVVRYQSLSDTSSLTITGTGDKDPFEGVQAKNVMTTLVSCLDQDETVGRAAEFFLRFRLNSSPVVDYQGKLVGILSEKDVIGVMTSLDSWNKPVREVMKTSVACYEEDTPVKAIYDFLTRVSVRRVIIVNDGFPTGLISRGTLLRWFSTWLAVHGQRPPVADETWEADHWRRVQGLRRTSEMLAESARRLQGQLTGGDGDFLPALIDSTSRMQELINDLLSDSRYFLQAQETGMGPRAMSQCAAGDGVGAAMAAMAALEQQGGVV
jgi:diguanylate cyclase (GGDEF)-like protein